MASILQGFKIFSAEKKDVFITYDDFRIGQKFELIILREVVAEDIGMFSCMANGARESYVYSIYLMLYSPPELNDREPVVTDFAPERFHGAYPIGYRQRIASCASGYARPLPKIYWEVINQADQARNKSFH